MDSVPPGGTIVDFNAELSRSTVVSNVAQNIFSTTEDRAKLHLLTYRTALDDTNQWKWPGSVLISLGATLLTADFHSFLGLTGAVIEGFFLCGTLFVAVWLALSAIRAFRARGETSVDQVVKDLMARRESTLTSQQLPPGIATQSPTPISGMS